ncbi:fasciclin domain-containing protein [Arcicella aurantiaca]|uniref:Fasciclin domain-containing protein n=1 Tax=Arcicella aurantiaca TaxID=591202 RepID=A0A316DIN1_9BACT|nr:fasciclin domain-containing protein [Arcicella aurantiaca]PWK18117.1 fasciclin domain-containing protein [Arcicella aurantiaca]
MIKKYTYLLILVISCISLSCERWDDRISLTDASLGRNLLEQISTQPDLSKFQELLVKSGYDKLISASQNYTVFAPSNKALEGFDITSLKDSASIRAFVGNHIALQAYSMPSTSTETNIKLLNGKYAKLNKGVFGESAIVTANVFVGNGVLHILDKYSPVLPSLWSYINSAKEEFAQNKLIANLAYYSFNPEKAIVDSISGTTGRPIYRPGSGFELKNQFTDAVYDLNDEAKQYTYFILNDPALTTEIAKVSPYFKTSTTDSTYTASAWNVVKDLAVEGYYTPDKLPDVLKSKFGVEIPLSKTAIVKTIKLSNGIAYIFNKVDFKLQDKIQSIVVEAETNPVLMQSIASATYAILEKKNPNTNLTTKHLLIAGHAVTNFWVRYRIPQVPAAKYKVYWVAVNDQSRTNYTSSGVTPPVTLTQRLAMGNVTNTTFANVTVTLNNFSEVLLGEYTTNKYGTLDIFLQGSGTTPIVLDYVRLVPVL